MSNDINENYMFTFRYRNFGCPMYRLYGNMRYIMARKVAHKLAIIIFKIKYNNFPGNFPSPVPLVD